jgi:hypothetical protein
VKRLRYSDWVPFGWHGIGIEIPAEWNPGKIGGDAKSGSVRLDDATAIRMELEWREARGDDRVGLIVDRYVEGLAKNAQKEGRKLSVERGAECPGLSLPHMRALEYFEWESESQVQTLACYSEASDRLLFLRIMGAPDESLEGLAPRILNSLTDTAPDQPRAWSLFDLAVTSPADYALESYELKSGHIQLSFEKGASSLRFDRLSLAGMLLRDRSLDDWYRDFFRKDIKHVDLETQEADISGHPGLVLSGFPKGRWRALLMPLPFWRVRPRRRLEGRAWACAEANKIYVVQAFWKRREDAPDIEACAAGVRCHEGPEDEA